MDKTTFIKKIQDPNHVTVDENKLSKVREIVLTKYHQAQKNNSSRFTIHPSECLLKSEEMNAYLNAIAKEIDHSNLISEFDFCSTREGNWKCFFQIINLHRKVERVQEQQLKEFPVNLPMKLSHTLNPDNCITNGDDIKRIKKGKKKTNRIVQDT